MSVGVMKDERVKLRNLRVSYTLGYSGNWNTYEFVYYESRKRDLQTGSMYECRCDERLKN
jgi:hypothetical protein